MAKGDNFFLGGCCNRLRKRRGWKGSGEVVGKVTLSLGEATIGWGKGGDKWNAEG